jgi:hypothetical protein
MKRILLACLVLCATAVGQSVIQIGAILPVEWKTSLDSRKARVGQTLTGRIAQDVPLGAGAKIHAGAKVIGRVVAVTPADGIGGGAQIAFRFDTVVTSKGRIPIATNLRALASPMAVWDAQLPLSGPDRGTSENAWTTVLIGGDEVAYRGGGPVAKGLQVVGKALTNGVLVQVSAKAGTNCRGQSEGNDQLQALWVFSSDSCGLYDLPDLRIAHAGRTSPSGVITLATDQGEVQVKVGSGMLLRVNGGTP